MLENYIKTALRSLSRNKTFSIINILGLSLGLACAMLIILYVKDEVSYDRFHKNAGSIYRIYSQGSKDGETRKMGITGEVQGPIFKAGIPGIVAYVRMQGGYGDFKTGADVFPESYLNVDSNFFSVFSFPMLYGDAQSALRRPDAVVISEDAARKYFASVDVVGKTIELKKDDKFEPFTVTGVTRRCPQNSSIQFDILFPFKASPDLQSGPHAWSNFFLNTYVLLRPNANVDAIEKKMTKIFGENDPEVIKKGAEQKVEFAYKLQPLLKLHLEADMDRYDVKTASNSLYSYMLTGIAFFILLIAAFNFINLTVGSSMKRSKEIGIRKVIGGRRKQLIFQFLGESFILCLVAFCIALVLVQLALPVFNRLSNKSLELSYLFDAKLVAGYIGLFLATGILAGFYPALVLSAYQPVETLYKRLSLPGKNYLQRVLVILQFSIASFLIVATLIIYYQFNFLVTTRLGYDASNLVEITQHTLKHSEAALLKNELQKNSNIVSVALKDGGYSFNPAKINGDSMIGFANVNIDEQFLPMLKIPLVLGRNFSKDFPSDSTRSAIVNEQFVRKAGWNNPLGQVISFGDNEKYSVIGVVKDYHYRPLNELIDPELFTMGAHQNDWTAYIKIKPANAGGTLNVISATLKKLFPQIPLAFEFRDQENLKNFEAEARWKQIVLLGAILTIFISCIGLFGLTVMATQRRTKEIGIRKVLGAGADVIVYALSKDFLQLVIIALVVALPPSYFVAAKWLENYPYRVHLAWWMFLGVSIAVVLIGALTVSFQTIRAAMANPVKSLRVD
ncbi:MAG TPA: ABC transporter permease [Puia sp.]|nr:ABC transporter permease [Puia sp.]